MVIIGSAVSGSKSKSNVVIESHLTSTIDTHCAMLAVVRGHLDFLQEAKLNIPEGTFEILCGKHVEDLTTSLKYTVASLGDAAASMAAVRESVLTEPKKNVIITAISEASSRSADGSAPKCSMANQEMMHMQHYLSEWDWTVFMADTATAAKKVETIVHRCRSIGLLSMSELYAQRGLDFRTEMDKRAADMVHIQNLAKQYGIPFELLFRPTNTPIGTVEGVEESEDEPAEMEEPESEDEPNS